jgi:hypothetical protein
MSAHQAAGNVVVDLRLGERGGQGVIGAIETESARMGLAIPEVVTGAGLADIYAIAFRIDVNVKRNPFGGKSGRDSQYHGYTEQNRL